MVPLREVLSKEFTRRIKDLGTVRGKEVEPMVEILFRPASNDVPTVRLQSQ